MELIIHVDGGSRGNPGPAGAGVVIRDVRGALIHEGAYFLGRQTNNAAEYQALLRALERARRNEPSAITIFSDSELLVRQLTGEYQVKSPRLAGLYEQTQRLLLRVPRWAARHIPREENSRADELANMAMDQRRNVIVFDAENQPGEPAEAPSAGEAASPCQGRPAIRVVVERQPDEGGCPAGGVQPAAFTVESVLPAGLCVHAAHAILPTILAMLNTSPQEFASVPTLTVRCSRPECGAVFQLSPARGTNGVPREPSA